MKIEKYGIEYSINEHFDISNKGEKMLKKYHSEGKCMYDKCTNNSIYSHTIPKMGALSAISVNDQLGYFVSKRERLQKDIIYDKIHINNATVFKGFCSYHDNKLFKSIDNNSDIKTDEEILLQAYRSVCKSLHEEGCYPFLELVEQPNFKMCKEFLEKEEAFEGINLDEYETEIMENYNLIADEHRNKILEWRNILAGYKESIERDIRNNFINIHTVKNDNSMIIRTSDEKVAILYNWFDWKIPVSLFNYHRLKGEKSVDCILNFTYIPYENSAEIFWVFINRDFNFFYDYWKWFLAEKINVLNTIESSMMASENWCISPTVIDDLPQERREIFFKDMYFNNERPDILKGYDMSIFDDIRIQLINENKCNVKKELGKLEVPFRESEDVRKKKYEKDVFDIL